MADKSSAFNNINAVKISIATQWGTITNATDNFAWSPEDIVIEATPGNDGAIFNQIFGSGGDVLLSATPLVNNWTVTLHFLYKSKTYAMFSYLAQKVMECNTNGTKPGWFNFELKDTNDVKGYEETLKSTQALLVTEPGKSWGINPNGDMAYTFILANATYLAPGYEDNPIATDSSNFKSINE